MRRYGELRREVSRREVAEARAYWAATHDALTGLPNRHYLDQKRDVVFRGVLALDLDGFKQVNDLLGHSGGDRLLIEIAKRITTAAPEELVLRTGGDEFVLLSQNGDQAHLSAIGEAVLEAVSRPVHIDGSQAFVSGSVGIATGADCDACADEDVDGAGGCATSADHERLTHLMRCADAAMYHAKRTGKNRIEQFHPRLEEEMTRQAQLEIALRMAIPAGEIAPYYQPYFNLDDGALLGFEVLARWRRTDGEFIPPSVFIPIAERSGQIVELSKRLLRRACLDARRWPDHLLMSFNISPVMLGDPQLAGRIAHTLKETEFRPDRLEIEITESGLIQEPVTAKKIVKELRALGVKISLDDFGTGFSSLSQLAQYSFDKIKIDRSFINSFVEDDKNLKIVKSIVSLGAGLGIKVTAEGVESELQRELLTRIGCDIAQGFLLGRPGDAERTADLLMETQCLSAADAEQVAVRAVG